MRDVVVFAGAIAGVAAVAGCASSGAVVDRAGRLIGDDAAGVIVRDPGRIVVVAAVLDCDGGGGALPFSLIGCEPPARLCCNVAVA